MTRILLEILVAIAVLVLALALDLLIGDPAPWKPWRRYYGLHPTIWMGKLAKALKPHFKNPNPRTEKVYGVFFAVIVIAAFTVPVFLGLAALYLLLSFAFYLVVAAILLKTTICIKLETDGAKAVAKALESGDLEEAKKYHHFSRRDPTNLTSPQIASAVIESMVENLTDFKHSPIIYYSLFGVSGAIAFRVINTLDGVVGFKDPEHINIGWFSANLDTIVNYIPARLTTALMIISAAIIGEDWRNAWRIAQTGSQKDTEQKPRVANGSHCRRPACSVGQAWALHGWRPRAGIEREEDFNVAQDKGHIDYPEHPAVPTRNRCRPTVCVPILKKRQACFSPANLLSTGDC